MRVWHRLTGHAVGSVRILKKGKKKKKKEQYLYKTLLVRKRSG